MVRVIAAALAAVGALVSAVEADTLRNFRIGTWHAGAYSFEGTSNFSHCAASAAYRSGILLLFSINRNYQWTMGFANPNWRLRKGSVYTIAYWIDDSAPIQTRARAISGSQASVTLEDSSSLFNHFRRGRVLWVSAAGQTFSFNLDETSKVLPALLQCVREETVVVQGGNRNPFVQQPQPRSQPLPQQKVATTTHHAEAAVVLSNVLSEARIQGFSVGTGDERPNLRADAYWRTNNGMVGTLKVLPTASLADAQTLQSVLIGDDAQVCQGAFVSGAVPDGASKDTLRVFTACDRSGETTTIYYLAVQRPRGGLYLFATLGTGTSANDARTRETDSNIRSAVFRGVR